MNEYQDRRVRKSKKALKKALMSLLKQQTLQHITVMEIVTKADVNRGTFYKHYQYKEQLLEEMVDDVIADLIVSYREPLHQFKELNVDNLTGSSIKIFEHVASYNDFYTVIAKSNALEGLQSRICQKLKDLMKEAASSQQPNQAIDLELIASYQAYALWGLIIEWIQQDFKYSASYIANQFLAILQMNRHV
ncbi:TetR/AcrR family transcriptional regulator [Gracilibacillus caseinilyticus]|uniref:TetR/AcrR family transcriptional regulator n=1 Tax=Gracilibacillus caseinilyticus TaxID=2932256 RepID=A0ABY4EWA2_9BACI|nr:TetR/AcrR family transcriptional regulator [Gracilibacillus caseinilyticus]UOQ48508.1 TetR/AcrR family transcriptional regulator [Gracilibacillus caseinilyticus]